MRRTTDVKEANRVSRLFKRVTKECDNLFQEGRERHRKKVLHLEEAVGRPPDQERKEVWLEEVAEGEDLVIEKTVRLYGKKDVTEQEIDLMGLPPKFSTYQKLEMKQMKFETTL